MKTALLVDDSLMTLRLGQHLLEPLGLKVTPAESAQIAYDIINQKNRYFDIIIIDYNLGPGENGIELGVKIRDMQRYASTPLIMLSGSEDHQLENWCKDAGFTGCYRKGLEGSYDFIQCIEKILGKSTINHAA